MSILWQDTESRGLRRTPILREVQVWHRAEQTLLAEVRCDQTVEYTERRVNMAIAFRSVISEDVAVKMFDDLHREVTGRYEYEVSENRDGSGADDAWYEHRVRLILSCKRGLIEE